MRHREECDFIPFLIRISVQGVDDGTITCNVKKKRGSEETVVRSVMKRVAKGSLRFEA